MSASLSEQLDAIRERAEAAAEVLHLRACYRAEYAHLLHDVDPDSTVPAIVVSLVKAPQGVAR